eukprot:CAMPEP_0174752492 /NCGR_PEP_ID=MMETSP1094-20130205/102184_1 /TAXON_ID=156173 /ORGANISM="Chrysochromulina brevifilum, Strain UTEX LB 985" /LENGTH=157 /DNA_ID=CAMNT_0015958143 /DNA_START=98 /DNA_END=568 /DNA_ORIENTATION=+
MLKPRRLAEDKGSPASDGDEAGVGAGGRDKRSGATHQPRLKARRLRHTNAKPLKSIPQLDPDQAHARIDAIDACRSQRWRTHPVGGRCTCTAASQRHHGYQSGRRPAAHVQLDRRLLEGDGGGEAVGHRPSHTEAPAGMGMAAGMGMGMHMGMGMQV